MNKLKIWLSARKQHEELEEEMRLHLELREQKLRAAGLSAADAASAARKHFGNALQLREDAREVWGTRWLDEFWQDARHTLHTLGKDWIFAISATATLALGIAANTTVFAFVNSLILKPLNIPHPDRLVSLTIHEWTENADMPVFNYPAFHALAGRIHSVEGLFTWNSTQFPLGWGASAKIVPGAAASGNYYGTMGVPPAIGRYFSNADDASTSPPTAVLSYSFWKSEFGGSKSVVGRIIRLDGHPFTIIGVQPADFPVLQTGTAPAITIPIHANDLLNPKMHILTQAHILWLSAFGRLRLGATVESANAEVAAMTKPVTEEIGLNLDDFDGSAMHAEKPRQTFGVIGGARGNRDFVARYDKPLWVLIFIAIAVLAIGALNIANLLLARAVAREREFGIRLALGAARWRLLRQLLTESLIISLAGAAIGFTAAAVAVPRAADFMSISAVTIDWRVLCFTAVVCVAVTLLCGLLPAFRAVALGAAALKSGRVGQTRGSAHLSRAAVCAQVALSIVLISGAILFAKTFETLLHEDPGFVRQNLVYTELDISRSHMGGKDAATFVAGVLEQMRHKPGITSAAITGVVPVSGSYSWEDLSPTLFPNLSRRQRQLFTHRVSSSYFATMGIRLLQGRDFPDRAGSYKEKLVVLSEKAAKVLFPNRSAVGESLTVGDNTLRIIGVVSDAKYQSIREPAPETAYVDIFQNGNIDDSLIGSTFLLVRTRLTAAQVGNEARAIVKRSGKDVTVSPAIPFDQQIENALITERVLAVIATAFAILGWALAAVGLYGLVAYSVTQRTTEIGLRMALGAGARRIVSGVLGEAAKLIGVGLVAGIVLAAVGSRFVATLLYGTHAGDPLVVALTICALAAVGAIAALFPAIRAARIDPMTALRAD